MRHEHDNDWSSALVAASSFLGLVIAVTFGAIAALSGGTGDIEYVAVGLVCGALFIAHLRLA